MFVAWGPNLVLFYNEAYAPFLGARHPWAMGQPLAVVWAEIWPDLEPLIRQVLAGEATWSEDQHLLMTRNGYEEDTWWTFSYSPLRDETGAVVGVLDICSDSTEKVVAARRVEAKRALLAESEGRFRALVNASSDVVYRMSPDWREARQLDGRGFLADIGGPTTDWIDVYVPEEDHPILRAAIAQSIAAKAPFELEHRVRQADGAIGWTLSRAIPVLGPDGEIVEWFGMATDVTERRRKDDHLRLVVNELNHRVKNNLAMVQSIAMQTFRRADDIDQAATQFSARLVALARANDLLTGERRTGVDLRGVLLEAVGSHSDDPERLVLNGEDVEISAKSALALTLAAHELATNAVKYGAWSNAAGVVTVRWTAHRLDKGLRLSLEWVERGGPTVSPPTRRGFGSRLIERGLSAELNGEVRLAFEPEGLVCRIEANIGDEDEMTIAMLLEDMIDGLGHTVAGLASRLGKALELAAADGFDLAILDVNLDGRSSSPVAQRLRDRSVPFFFATGYGRSGVAPAFADVLVLNKPFLIEELARGALAQPGQGQRVGLAGEVLVQRLAERRLVRSCGLEKGQAGAQLQVVGRAEDGVGVVTGQGVDGLHRLHQARAQHGVGQIGSRLGQVGDGVELSGGAAAQAGDLWEDEPHPVASLLASPQFGQRRAVGAGLGVDKAGEGAGVWHFGS